MVNNLHARMGIIIGIFLLFINIFSCLPVKAQNIISPAKGDISIDFSQSTGKIKLLHGVNNGPFGYGLQSAPLAGYHAEAGFPYTRLHDVNWPNAEAVDIHSIFPLFDADADDPKNYFFKKTDDYITAIIKNKSEIIYRLGESIEHRTHYFIHPPKDYAKWAKICVNIIRHYNEGWNNGFHYNIKYWEIWNEPDGENMWRGTVQQFFQLYEVAAKAIKTYNPELQVGGPGASGLSAFSDQFLTYCRDKSIPLDFFSWHYYSDKPEVIVDNAKYARKLLDKYGFKHTKSFLDEWHFMNVPWSSIFPGTGNLSRFAGVRTAFAEINGHKGAVFAAAVLMRLQDVPVDVTAYYSADYYNPFSMFDIYGVPGKVYYAFKAFNELAKMGNRVACARNDPGQDSAVTMLAAQSEDKNTAAILISNSSTSRKPFTISLKNFPGFKHVRANVYLIDQEHDLDEINNNSVNISSSALQLDLPPYSVCLLKLTGVKE